MENKRPRILIVTAPVGNGHNVAAHAIRLSLEKEYNADVKIHDIFIPASPFRAWWHSKFYFWMARYFIERLNKFHRDLKNGSITKEKSLPILIGGKVKPALANEIDKFMPDAVISTHIAGAIAVSDFKQEKKFFIPTFFITTDYDIVPYIEYCRLVDYFVTPSKDFDQEFLRYSIEQKRILPYGIPTDPKFSVQLDKTETRRRFGLKEDLFTVLITNGYVGLGDTVKLIKELFSLLPNDIQIISVCGKNAKLKRKIDVLIQQGQANLLNYGFIDNIDEIMSASDLLIGKLGGLTTTEALNKNLCILAVTNLPMQEYDNMLYLSSYGVCGYIKNPAEAGAMVTKYVKNPEILSDMRKNIGKIIKPNVSANIAKAVIRMAQGKSYPHAATECLDVAVNA
ncbi:MAG: hypothetical protein LBU72_06645 [Burkholderiaceae bacterium]|jgi:processive 1,2-diacylglycerol beta-glucosyltransferase|nr:hypothetical protein [Burkholderiaceae bacterium]